MNGRRRHALAALAACPAVGLWGWAQAQDNWPNKPLRIVQAGAPAAAAS